MGDTYKVRIFVLKRRLDEEIRLLDRNSTDCNRHTRAVRQLPVAPHHQRGADNGTVINYNRCSWHCRAAGDSCIFGTSRRERQGGVATGDC